MNLTTNKLYVGDHISLESILRNGWIRGNDVDYVLEEAISFGYDINKNYIINMWLAFDTEMNYYDFSTRG